VDPHRLLQLSTTANVLVSRVDVTGAPLPLAPAFSSWTALRAGAVDGPRITTVVRHRGGAASNLFGTLRAPAYTLVDVIGVWPVTGRLSLSVALTNALDVQTARDANLLPLPGRQVFFSLEVRS
jgi:outer membrane receptor protein involved in Fe transport